MQMIIKNANKTIHYTRDNIIQLSFRKVKNKEGTQGIRYIDHPKTIFFLTVNFNQELEI